MQTTLHTEAHFGPHSPLPHKSSPLQLITRRATVAAMAETSEASAR